MIRVDSHLHPNFNFLLPDSSIRRHAEKLWRQFTKYSLDAVFVSEHSFKHPVRSFRELQKHRPVNSRTMLIPAVEALSKEGLDLIVFSRDEHVYAQRDILTPYGLPFETMLSRVESDPGLHCIIPHPFLLGVRGLIHNHTRNEIRECICRVRCVEKYNACPLLIERILGRFGLDTILKRTCRRLCDTEHVPDDMIGNDVTVFAGSDAHHWWDIGSCLQIHAELPENENDLFRMILSDAYRRTVEWRKHTFVTIPLLLDGVTSFLEAMKQRLRLWRVEDIIGEFPPPLHEDLRIRC